MWNTWLYTLDSARFALLDVCLLTYLAAAEDGGRGTTRKHLFQTKKDSHSHNLVSVLLLLCCYAYFSVKRGQYNAAEQTARLSTDTTRENSLWA